jgi:hypothetical protein
MSTIIVLNPCSHETQWLMSLKIKPGVSRIMAAMNKITRLFHQARYGRPYDIVTLFNWHQSIFQLDNYFNKEIARLTKIIKRRYKDKLLFEPMCGAQYRIKVSTPPSADFYSLLSKHDTLMCLVEACVALNIFKKRRTLSKKHLIYSKGLLKLITQIGQYKISRFTAEGGPLSEKDQGTLSMALQSDVIPVLKKSVFDDLIAQTAITT